jgi:hypothetical protein
MGTEEPLRTSKIPNEIIPTSKLSWSLSLRILEIKLSSLVVKMGKRRGVRQIDQ